MIENYKISDDIFNLVATFTQTIGKQKNYTNLLFMACHQVISTFNQEELIYGNIASLIGTRCGDKVINKYIDAFVASFYCIIASHRVIYSLPSMMNQNLVLGSVSCHRLFGESIAQLVSVILIGEAYNILNQIGETDIRHNLLKYLNKELHHFRQKSIVIQKINTLDKDTIKQDYSELKKRLLHTIINGSLLICGNDPLSEKQIDLYTNSQKFDLKGFDTCILKHIKYQNLRGEK